MADPTHLPNLKGMGNALVANVPPELMMFQDLKDPRWIIAKGILFLLAGILASGLLLAEVGSWRTATLLGLSIWCFCRFYYFAFYVVQHYIDPQFKFAGLGSVLAYLLKSTHHRD